jgi:hypothetical protein
MGGGTMLPAIDGERVYFNRGEFKIADEVAALDRTSGKMLWHRRDIDLRLDRARVRRHEGALNRLGPLRAPTTLMPCSVRCRQR